MTEETKRKISATLKNRKRSAEHSKHLSESLKGRKLSSASKKKISDTLKRKEILPPSRKGTHITEWHKEQIRKSLIGKKQTLEHVINVIKSFKFRKPTSIELKVQEYLESQNIIFEAQKQVGRFIADIYIPERNLIIECDGSYWHSRDGAKEKDEIKNKFYLDNGYSLLRLSEKSINSGRFKKKI